MAKKEDDWLRIPMAILLMPLGIGLGWFGELQRYFKEMWDQ